MRFTTQYRIFMLLGGLLISTNIAAQQVNNAFTDINYIRKTNAWLNAKNAAGLTNYKNVNFSKAALYAEKFNGDFKNYNQSNNSIEYGLNAGSVSRLNNKVVLSGNVGYTNFEGKQMGGSAFINPYENPFDIVELDDANKGNKQLEVYNLNGAVGVQLTSKLSVGGKFNYQAANFAKIKDLRHINKLLAMNLTAGATYKISNLVEAGVNYEYDRRIESISFRTYGNTDRTYLSLISYGSFYGRTEVFDQYGYTSSSNTNPLVNVTHGGSVQLNFNFNPQIKLFNEFSLGKKTGYFGQSGTSSILLTKHEGTLLAYKTQLSVINKQIEHHIAFTGNYDYLENNENIYRRETTTGGVNGIVYYGNKQIYNGEHWNANLDYQLYLDVKNNAPKWALNLSASYYERNQSTNIYPFYRDQKFRSYQINTKLNRQFYSNNNGFNVGVGLGYGNGSGKAKIDGYVAVPSSAYRPLVSTDMYLNEEFEFFTSQRFKGDFEFKYVRTSINNIGFFAKINYTHNFANYVVYLGKHANVLKTSIGLNF